MCESASTGRGAVQAILARRYKSPTGELRADGLHVDAVRALAPLLACRTDALGTHILQCTRCSAQIIAPNRCATKMCASCAPAMAKQWVERMMDDFVLPTPVHHVVFTLPPEFTRLWGYFPREIGSALLKAGARSIIALLANDDLLGAIPAIIGLLHTSAEDMAQHLHGHFCVSAGGVDDKHEWRTARKPTLIPYDPAKILFQKFFLQALRRALCRPGMQLTFEQIEQVQALQLAIIAHEAPVAKRWNAWIGPRLDDPEPILRYFAKRLYGGPISDERIVDADEHSVRFTCDDWHECPGSSGSPPTDLIELSFEEFIRRWRLHVPPYRMQYLRFYGVYSHAEKDGLYFHARFAFDLGELDVKHDKRSADEPSSSKDEHPLETKLTWVRCVACRAPMERRIGIEPPRQLRVPGWPYGVPVKPKPMSLAEALGRRRFHIPRVSLFRRAS